MTSPIETNNVVERLIEANPYTRYSYPAQNDAVERKRAAKYARMIARLASQSLSDRIDVLRGEVNNSWLQWKADELSAEDAMNAIFDAAFPSASLTQGGKNVG